MILKLTLRTAVVALTLAGGAHADLAADRARFPQLVDWITESQRLERELAAAYEYRPAPQTQRKAFEAGGVQWAQRYSQAWGGWLFTDWDVARKVHRRTLDELKDTLHRRKMGQVLPANHMGQLEQRMGQLRRQHARLRTLFARRVDCNVKQGLELDQQHEQFQKYLLALAANSATADYHKARADQFAARAEVWRKRGGAVSAEIRRIGYGQPAPASPAAETAAEPEPDVPVILTGHGITIRPVLIR